MTFISVRKSPLISVRKSLLISKFETQERRSLPKRVILIGAALITLVILEIWVNNAMAIFGQRLASTETAKKSLQLENRVLENEIAMKGSLDNIASSSATLGFIKPKTIQYVR